LCVEPTVFYRFEFPRSFITEHITENSEPPSLTRIFAMLSKPTVLIFSTKNAAIPFLDGILGNKFLEKFPPYMRNSILNLTG